jgi:carbon monoxide dehydrogenase subunit G
MKLENEFTVPASVDRAWEVLLDLERVAPCLPGAAIDGRDGDAHTGTMTVKIGPITARYKGTVRIEESDEQAHRAVMRAQARDVRGQGSAAATITSTMETVADGTRVRVETDIRITGPAAQFGRGVMQDVSAKMMGRFAECLAGLMGEAEAPAAAAPAPAEDTRAEDAPSGDAPAPEPKPPEAAPPPPARPTDEVLDLGEVSRDAVLKRVAPVVAGAGALLLLLLLRRRR